MEIPTPPIPPDLDGYLSKLKHKQSIFGSWNKRYFKINQESYQLEYYPHKPTAGEEPSGIIDLNLLHAVRKFDGYSFQLEAGSKVYLLRANSAAEQACWINELERFINEKSEYEQRKVSYDIAQQER